MSSNKLYEKMRKRYSIYLTQLKESSDSEKFMNTIRNSYDKIVEVWNFKTDFKLRKVRDYIDYGLANDYPDLANDSDLCTSLFDDFSRDSFEDFKVYLMEHSIDFDKMLHRSGRTSSYFTQLCYDYDYYCRDHFSDFVWDLATRENGLYGKIGGFDIWNSIVRFVLAQKFDDQESEMGDPTFTCAYKYDSDDLLSFIAWLLVDRDVREGVNEDDYIKLNLSSFSDELEEFMNSPNGYKGYCILIDYVNKFMVNQVAHFKSCLDNYLMIELE